MSTFDHDGLHFQYEQHGTGTPVVLVPGIMGDARLWQRILPLLATHRQVIAFDNRDAGGSSLCPERDYTPADMAGDVLALLDHLDLPSAHVIGHSLGGQVAQEMSLASPDRVLGIVLANTWGKGDGELAALLELREGFSHELSDDLFLRQALYFNFGPSFFRSTTLDQVTKAFLANGKLPARDAFRRQIGAARRADTVNRLASIRAPALIIWGNEDRDFSAHHAQVLGEGIANARAVCFEGVGHCPMIERPAAFAEAVNQFFDTVERAASVRVVA